MHCTHKLRYLRWFVGLSFIIKSTTNLGHFVISCVSPVVVQIWAIDKFVFLFAPHLCAFFTGDEQTGVHIQSGPE